MDYIYIYYTTIMVTNNLMISIIIIINNHTPSRIAISIFRKASKGLLQRITSSSLLQETVPQTAKEEQG
jgi:hypothetical protein